MLAVVFDFSDFTGRPLSHWMTKIGATLVVLLVFVVGCDRQQARSAAKARGITPNNEALLAAALKGDNESVQLLLRGGCSVNAVEEQTGRTPLINAAERGHTEVARTLLAAGANVNQRIEPKVFRSGLPLPGWESRSERHKPGWTPLMFAVSGNHSNTVELLLQHRANVNAQGMPKRNQGNNNATPLLLACGNGNAGLAARLIKAGADINASDLMGATPLWLARNVETLEVLRAAGANLKQTNKAGASLLFPAVSAVDQKRVRYLLDAGLDPNARDAHGTPVIFSSYGIATELLVKAGADINATNAAGKTLLMERASDGRFSGTVPFLMKLGARLDGITDWQALNLLRDAVQANEVTTARAAIQAGAKPTGPLLITAAHHGDLSMVQLLLDHGSDARAAAPNGATPLHSAAVMGHVEAARLLLKAGADPNARLDNGKTPLDWAIEYKWRDMAELLRPLTNAN